MEPKKDAHFVITAIHRKTNKQKKKTGTEETQMQECTHVGFQRDTYWQIKIL